MVDITFLGSATDSTLFTDTGISIFDEESGFEEPLFIPYELINNVNYKDGEFVFFLESGEEIPVDDHFIIYDSDAANRYTETFIILINKLAKLFVRISGNTGRWLINDNYTGLTRRAGDKNKRLFACIVHPCRDL